MRWISWNTIQQFLNTRARLSNESALVRYALPVVLVIIVFLFKITFFSLIQQDVPFLLSSLIVIISAWNGGLWPGILATVLTGVLTHTFFLTPSGQPLASGNLGDIVIVVLFFIEGLIVSIISEARRKNDVQKSEFIGVISHELKNPLTSIKGYAELIHRRALQQHELKISDFSARINTQIGYVIEIVNDLLDVTKIETGRLTYQKSYFPIKDVVKDVIADQQVTAATHRILLSGTSRKIIFGDPYRIRQVLSNLISNAMKYSPESKTVHVTLKDTARAVTISVKDTGVGISERDLANVFSAFVRGDNSKGTNIQGTGIGLFISSQIVSKHHGKLWAKSTLGKGSTFFLQLPAASRRKKSPDKSS